MSVCLFVCMSRKMITFPFRAERRRRKVRRPLGLAGLVVMMMMSMMELVASKRSMMHWGLCQPHQCNHPFSPKLAQRVLLNFCRIGFSQWTFSVGEVCKQGQLSKRSREIHNVFLYLRDKPSSTMTQICYPSRSRPTRAPITIT